MITRIEAKQYRCFQSVAQDLRPFQVLVGPNGSGKSVFLDVIAFLGDFVSNGLEAAVNERTENFHDLVWGRQGSCFELAIEARKPEEKFLWTPSVRYELTVTIHAPSDTLVVTKEYLDLSIDRSAPRTIVNRTSKEVHFSPETPDREESGPGLGGNYSALAHLDESRFPASVWFRDLLRNGVLSVVLDNQLLRKPSAPAKGNLKTIDGSNLARLVFQLQSESKERFDWWVAHVQTALPDLDSIRTVLRPEDKHRYLMLRYKNGIEAPSWVVSHGTLRLLALTILAYLPDFKGIYLIEEPENGVHPTALETIYQSLSSVYDGQVLVTSHSPILLNLPKLEELLCFQKAPEGTEIIRGDAHPALSEWKGSVGLGQLFAAGVLG